MQYVNDNDHLLEIDLLMLIWASDEKKEMPKKHFQNYIIID